MIGGKVLGAGLACVDVVDKSISLGGTSANVMTILAQMGFDASMLTTEYTNEAGKWYSNALNMRRIFPIYFQTSKKQLPIVLEEMDESGKKHYFRTKCPNCKNSLMNVILPTQKNVENVLNDKQQFNMVFYDRFSSGIKAVAEKNNKAWIMYEPNASRMYSNLLNGCRLADIVKFSSDRISDSISDKLLIDLKNENTKIVIVSMGERGLKFTIKNNWNWREWAYISSTKKNVVDAAGAGDWLTAIFLKQLLNMYPEKRNFDEGNMIDMLEFAQTIAQKTCDYKGAQGILKNKEGVKALKLMTGEEFWQLRDEDLDSKFLSCPTCGKIFI